MFLRLNKTNNRPNNEAEFVGYYYSFPAGKDKYTSSLPPSEILINALITTLRENGHEATSNEKTDSTNLIFSVQLNKFLQDFGDTDMKGNVASVFLGHISADIEIINLTKNQVVFKKTVNTIDSQPFTWNLKKSYEEAYSKHIKQFIDDIFLDFELIGTLKKI